MWRVKMGGAVRLCTKLQSVDEETRIQQRKRRAVRVVQLLRTAVSLYGARNAKSYLLPKATL